MWKKLSYLSKKIVKANPETVAIILYGSYARGEAGKKSDIDILIILERKNNVVEEKLADIIESTTVGRKVIPTFATPKELTKTPYYIFDIIKDGIVLYKNAAKPFKLPFAFGEKAMTIYTFSTTHLAQKKKTKLNRLLYGAEYTKVLKTKKQKKKKYSYPGTLDKVGGKRLGAGSIITPSRAEKQVEKLFNYCRIRFEKSHLLYVEEMY